MSTDYKCLLIHEKPETRPLSEMAHIGLVAYRALCPFRDNAFSDALEDDITRSMVDADIADAVQREVGQASPHLVFSKSRVHDEAIQDMFAENAKGQDIAYISYMAWPMIVKRANDQWFTGEERRHNLNTLATCLASVDADIGYVKAIIQEREDTDGGKMPVEAVYVLVLSALKVAAARTEIGSLEDIMIQIEGVPMVLRLITSAVELLQYCEEEDRYIFRTVELFGSLSRLLYLLLGTRFLDQDKEFWRLQCVNAMNGRACKLPSFMVDKYEILKGLPKLLQDLALYFTDITSPQINVLLPCYFGSGMFRASPLFEAVTMVAALTLRLDPHENSLSGERFSKLTPLVGPVRNSTMAVVLRCLAALIEGCEPKEAIEQLQPDQEDIINMYMKSELRVVQKLEALLELHQCGKVTLVDHQLFSPIPNTLDVMAANHMNISVFAHPEAGDDISGNKLAICAHACEKMANDIVSLTRHSRGVVLDVGFDQERNELVFPPLPESLVENTLCVMCSVVPKGKNGSISSFTFVWTPPKAHETSWIIVGGDKWMPGLKAVFQLPTEMGYFASNARWIFDQMKWSENESHQIVHVEEYITETNERPHVELDLSSRLTISDLSDLFASFDMCPPNGRNLNCTFGFETVGGTSGAKLTIQDSNNKNATSWSLYSDSRTITNRLSSDQVRALGHMLIDDSVAVVGGGNCGKKYLLSAFYQLVRGRKDDPLVIAVADTSSSLRMGASSIGQLEQAAIQDLQKFVPNMLNRLPIIRDIRQGMSPFDLSQKNLDLIDEEHRDLYRGGLVSRLRCMSSNGHIPMIYDNLNNLIGKVKRPDYLIILSAERYPLSQLMRAWSAINPKHAIFIGFPGNPSTFYARSTVSLDGIGGISFETYQLICRLQQRFIPMLGACEPFDPLIDQGGEMFGRIVTIPFTMETNLRSALPSIELTFSSMDPETIVSSSPLQLMGVTLEESKRSVNIMAAEPKNVLIVPIQREEPSIPAILTQALIRSKRCLVIVYVQELLKLDVLKDVVMKSQVLLLESAP